MTRALVAAKAPVPGRAKTRLGETVGDLAAARLAAAALLDTIEACATAFGPARCHLALAGDLAEAVEAEALREALAGWTVVPQRGEGFAERLAAAHADLARPTAATSSVVQVGMDTPQLTPAVLLEVALGLEEHDAVLGPAEDGGWWVLALRDPLAAAVLREVPMSTAETHDLTRDALRAAGLDVGTAPVLRDVDTADDAERVAREAVDTRFAAAWRTAVLT